MIALYNAMWTAWQDFLTAALAFHTAMVAAGLMATKKDFPAPIITPTADFTDFVRKFAHFCCFYGLSEDFSGSLPKWTGTTGEGMHKNYPGGS